MLRPPRRRRSWRRGVRTREFLPTGRLWTSGPPRPRSRRRWSTGWGYSRCCGRGLPTSSPLWSARCLPRTGPSARGTAANAERNGADLETRSPGKPQALADCDPGSRLGATLVRAENVDQLLASMPRRGETGRRAGPTACGALSAVALDVEPIENGISGSKPGPVRRAGRQGSAPRLQGVVGVEGGTSRFSVA